MKVVDTESVATITDSHGAALFLKNGRWSSGMNSTKVMLSSVCQSRNVYFGGRNRDGRTVEMGFLLLLASLFRANYSL